MRHPASAGLSTAVLAALVSLTFGSGPVPCALAQSRAEQDRPRVDEFGTIPEDAVDRNLRLPDPRLDDRWPGPLPGDPIPPPTLPPAQPDVDPFEEEEAARPPRGLIPRDPPADGDDDAGFGVERPWSPPRAPDGRIDEGNPDPQPDPLDENYDLEGYDTDPQDLDSPGSDRGGRSPYGELDEYSESLSPLDEGDDLLGGDDDFFDTEMDDPGEW